MLWILLDDKAYRTKAYGTHDGGAVSPREWIPLNARKGTPQNKDMAQAIPTNEPRWYVIYTKTRAEKKAAQILNDMDITCYCPVRQEVRQWSDRRKKVDVPVLPSMVLVRILEKERVRVFDCPLTTRYLFMDGEPAVVKDEEITALKESLKKGVVLSHEVSTLEPGSEIDLTEFGFTTEPGTVKYVSNNYCWINLKSLGMVVKLRLDKEGGIG